MLISLAFVAHLLPALPTIALRNSNLSPVCPDRSET